MNIDKLHQVGTTENTEEGFKAINEYYAEIEIERAKLAKELNIPNPTLFYRNNSFRSVSVIDDKENAKDVLYKIKQFRSDAYIVDLNIWCKNPETKDKYTICS